MSAAARGRCVVNGYAAAVTLYAADRGPLSPFGVFRKIDGRLPYDCRVVGRVVWAELAPCYAGRLSCRRGGLVERPGTV